MLKTRRGSTSLMTRALTLLACASMAAGLNSAMAEDKAGSNKNDDAAKTEGGEAIAQATLAAQLYLNGEKRKSPIMLLSAAEILGSLQESGKDTDDVEEETSDVKGKSDPTFTYRGLLARAQELAKGDETLEQLVAKRIDDLRNGRGLVYSQGKNLPSEKLRGITFKVIDRDVISGNDTARYTNVIFEGQKPAKVVVVGDGDGDLDLYVYDGKTGNEIDRDTDASSVCICSWTTRWEGPFTIKVSNVGSIAERYVVLVNW